MNKTEKNRIIRNIKTVARELKNIPAAAQVKITREGVEIAGLETCYFSPVDFKCGSEIYMDAATFTDAWRTLEIQEVKLNDNGNVEIKTADGSYFNPQTDPGQRIAADFISAPPGDWMPVEILHSVAPYMCADDLRPALCGVYCGPGSDGRPYVVATNRHIMRAIPTQYGITDVIIPARGVKMLPPKGDWRIRKVQKYGTGAKYIRLGRDSYAGAERREEIFLAQIDHKYPDFVSVIPSEYSERITLPAGEFLKAIGAAKKINPTTKQLKITGRGNGEPVQISARDVDFNSTFQSNHIGTASGSELIEIGFNAEYLETVIKNTGGEVVEIEYTPGKYFSAVNGALVMQVMLNSYA